MKVILAATDFSESGNNAVLYAAGLACSYQARLIILNTYMIVSPSASVVSINYLLDNIHEENEKQMSQLVVKVRQDTCARDITPLVRLANVKAEIMSTAKEECADLIVMGIRGKTRITEKLIGSTTASIIARNELPVLTVPEESQYREYKNILLATDYKPLKDVSYLDLLKNIAEPSKATVHVVSVITGEEEGRDDEEGVMPEEYLDTFDQDIRFIENENIIDGLNDLAEKADTELLVTLPRRHSFLYNLINGSITRQMVFHTIVPMLALPCR